MEVPEETQNEDVRQILLEIRDANKFRISSASSAALAAAVSFIIALALNEALKKTFALIPVGGGLLGLWIYALLALALGLTFLWLINRFLQPALAKTFKEK
jgi:hypothetical protein